MVLSTVITGVFFSPQFNYVRPHMTLLMTGSHTLAELRDAICCVSDLQVCGEFSNTPDVAPDFTSKVSTCAFTLCGRTFVFGNLTQS